jgi:hypothetical protein
MAFDRNGWKNRFLEYTHGAAYEYFLARLFELNGQTKWVEHKFNEVERLLDQMQIHFNDAKIKGKWDRAKAAKEVLSDLYQAQSGYGLRANNAYKGRYFSGANFSVPYDEKLSALVWKEFKQKLDDALEFET